MQPQTKRYGNDDEDYTPNYADLDDDADYVIGGHGYSGMAFSSLAHDFPFDFDTCLSPKTCKTLLKSASWKTILLSLTG